MFPILYSKNNRGVEKQWSIQITIEKGIPILLTSYGQRGGKLIESRRPVSSLKKGKTSLEQMAKEMAESKWKHKKEREGYSEYIGDPTFQSPNILPMLAKTFDKGKHLFFPLYLQPKIDGLRCVCLFQDEKVKLFSRTQIEFSSPCLDLIKKDLFSFFQQNPNIILDGELYSDNLPFEELSGHIRNQHSTDSSIYYIFFDRIEEDLSFQKRFIEFGWRDSPFCKKLESYKIHSIEDAFQYHKVFSEQGWEGSIFRNIEGKYKKGYRSWDLQKKKNVQEEEFEIVGFEEAEGGREKGSIIWECQTKDGKKFSVRPRGSLEYRKQLFAHGSNHLGDFLTVIFQEKTKDGIPRFPVGKEIRKNY